MTNVQSSVFAKLTISALLGLACTNGPVWSQFRKPVDRKTIIAWLQHHEGLVRACESSFQLRQLPTSTEMAGLIREVTGNPSGAFGHQIGIFTEETVRKPHFRCQMKWWRKGVKERAENFWMEDDLDNGSYRSALAFDGQIVRRFTPSEHEPGKGSVQTVRSSDWNEMSYRTPYDMLYEFYKTPWSEVVRQGTEFAAEVANHNGKMLTTVSLRPSKVYQKVVLVFDAEHRMIEQQYTGKPALGKEPQLVTAVTLSDYRPHPDQSGEVIWFPYFALYKGYLGRALNGTLIQSTGTEVQILDIKFNGDIPDSLFDLRFPRNAVVFDGATNLGFLEPGERPAHLFPEQARQRRWLLGGVVGAVIVLALSAFAAWSRRKRSLLLNHQ
jgi:hypothetical protein